MAVLLFFILACFGMTQILVYGEIFDKIRPKHQFFHCPMCIGFWVGLLVTPLVFTLYDALFLRYELLSSMYSVTWYYTVMGVVSFLGGCVSSGTSYALSMLFGDCGFRIEINKDKEE